MHSGEYWLQGHVGKGVVEDSHCHIPAEMSSRVTEGLSRCLHILRHGMQEHPASSAIIIMKFNLGLETKEKEEGLS